MIDQHGVPNLPRVSNLPRMMNLPCLIIGLTPKLIPKGWPTHGPSDPGWQSNPQSWLPITLGFSMVLAWGPLICPYKEIIYASRSKILPHNQISYIWEGNPKYLGTLLSTRKFSRIKGLGSALHYYINNKP